MFFDVVGDGPIILVARVNRADKLVALFQDWLKEVPDPIAGNGSQIRVDHHTGLDLEPVGSLKHGAKGRALPRWPTVNGGALLLPGLDLKFSCNLPGVVRRALMHGSSLLHPYALDHPRLYTLQAPPRACLPLS